MNELAEPRMVVNILDFAGILMLRKFSFNERLRG